MTRRTHIKLDLAYQQTGVVFAFLVGLASVFAVRWALFQQTGSALVGYDPGLILMLESGASIGLSFMVFLFLPFRGFLPRMAQVAGVMLMITGMHFLVHAAPGQFAQLFSEDWVATIIDATDPGAFYVGIPAATDPAGFADAGAFGSNLFIQN